MAKWGNALGGYRKQKRNAKGQFGSGSGSRAKKKVRKTTVSRKNGTTYKTTHKRGLLGNTVETTAYRGREFRGTVSSVHSRKKSGATIDFLYVAPDHRGKGVSRELVGRQIYHAKRHGYDPKAPADRSDGGQKFIDRNNTAGVKVSARSSMSSSEVTEVMDDIGAYKAKRHQRNYDKARKKKNKPMSKKRKAAIGGAIATGAVVATIAFHEKERSKLNKELLETGSLTRVNGRDGVTYTTYREVKRGGIGLNEKRLAMAVIHQENGKNLRAYGNVALGAKINLRPSMGTTTFIHSGDDLHGYFGGETRGKRFTATSAYIRESSRGKKSVIAGLNSEAKKMQAHQVSKGRKIHVSGFRTSDSERVIRNQTRKLKASDVVIHKRIDPGFDTTKMIQDSMDASYKNDMNPFFGKLQEMDRKRQAGRRVQ